MAAPVLSDYQLQFKDTGFLINGNAALPFIDVTKVTGISDLPEYDVKEDDIDGQDGSFLTVRNSKYRLITIEGILYTSPTTADVTLDTLRTNFLPDNVEWPFYFKPAGVAQRYCNCKALGFKTDVDAIRRIGASTCLITLGAQNPHMRVDNATTTLAVTNTNYAVTNSGSVATFPTFTINGGTMTSITLTNATTAQSLTLTRAFTSGDVVSVDMRNGLVYVNGIQNGSIASGTFWSIPAGATNNIKFTWTGSVVASSVKADTYSGWM